MGATADYWDNYVARYLAEGAEETYRAEWLFHPLVQDFHRRLRGGLTLEDWLIASHLDQKTVAQAVGLGAGVGSFELNLVARGVVERAELVDVSPVAITEAAETARRLGIADRVVLHCQDQASLSLGHQTCDLVTFISSLHHVIELESTVAAVAQALRPGGILFASEYIGPNRFAFPPADVAIARSVYRLLDGDLRSPWPELPLPDPLEVEKSDPTEAAHSQEIVACLKRCFEYVEVVPLHGALIYPLWFGLNHDQLYETPAGREAVATLLTLDAALGRSGKLPTYFALLVASNGPLGAGPLG
jgi:SAM-dependent methyltransferase